MAKLKIHFFQHVPYEGPGCIDFWAQAKGHTLNGTKFYQNDTVPNIDSIDWLVVLGGPFSVNDAEKYDWMKQEKLLIEQAVKKNKTVIGICLGAQLIASVLGAKVGPNEKKEIGWFDVKLNDTAKQSEIFGFMPESFTAFHWHEETFDLPKHAKLLMSSEACTNQAFQVGKRVFGFQFHPEVTSGILNEMLEGYDKNQESVEFVQSYNEMIEKSENISGTHQMMRQLLNNINDLT